MYANEREFVSLSASPEHLARFAFTNYAQNGGAYETMSNARWNVRVPVAKLDAILERLCGTTLDDWSELNSTSSSFLYEDGYVYTQITNGFPLNGPAVTTSVEGWRKGTFRVEFDAYSYPKEKTGYKIGDRSQYSMTEPQLNNLLGVSGPDRRGGDGHQFRVHEKSLNLGRRSVGLKQLRILLYRHHVSCYIRI